MSRYKLNFFIPLVSIITFASLTLVIFAYFIYHQHFEYKKLESTSNFHQVFTNEIHKEALVLQGYLNFIKDNQEIQEAFFAKDRKRLMALTIDIYKDLNHKIDLTHFYFIDRENRTFLRLHDINRYGDTIERFTFKKAKELKTLYWGIEFGIKKTIHCGLYYHGLWMVISLGTLR